MVKQVLIKKSQVDKISQLLNELINQDLENQSRTVHYISKIIDSILFPETTFYIESKQLLQLRKLMQNINMTNITEASGIVTNISIIISKKEVQRLLYKQKGGKIATFREGKNENNRRSNGRTGETAITR